MELTVPTIDSIVKQVDFVLENFDRPDKEQVMKEAAKLTVEEIQNQYGMTESEAKGAAAMLGSLYLANKGLEGDELDRAIARQLNILDATQADVGSFRLSLAKYAPQISSAMIAGGGAAFLSRIPAFLQAVASGAGVLGATAALGPIGWIGTVLSTLGLALPFALNTSNDFTAMQPTMMLQALMNLKKEINEAKNVGIVSYGNFTKTDFENLTRTYREMKITDYPDYILGANLVLDEENIADSIKRIVQRINALKGAATKDEVLKILSGWVLGRVSAEQRREMEKPIATITTGEERPTELATIRKSKSAKPKIFLGTLLAGRLAETEEYTRKVDDEITSEEDLINDAITQMTEWLATLPGKITYEIQVKNNPFGEFGERHIGIWATLALYITNKFNKRMFIDEILLGPLDPIKYYPETIRTESITFQIKKNLIPTKLKPTGLPNGPIATIDEQGNVITGIFGGRQVEEPKQIETQTQAINQELERQKQELQQRISELQNQVANLQKQVQEKQRQETKEVPFGLTAPFVPPQKPAPAPAPAPTPTTSERQIGDRYIVQNDIAGELNLRDQPKLQSRILGTFKNGTEVVYLGDQGWADGFNWWAVRVVPTGQVGFMAAKHLKKL